MSSPLTAPFSVFPSYKSPHKPISPNQTHIHHQHTAQQPTALNIHIPTFPSPPTSTAPSPASHHSAATDGYPFPSIIDHNAASHKPTRPQLKAREIPTSDSLESLPVITACPAAPAQKPSDPPTVNQFASENSAASSATSSPTNSLKKFKWPISPIVSGAPKRKQVKRNRSVTMRCGRHGDEWLGVRGWRFWR